MTQKSKNRRKGGEDQVQFSTLQFCKSVLPLPSLTEEHLLQQKIQDRESCLVSGQLMKLGASPFSSVEGKHTFIKDL